MPYLLTTGSQVQCPHGAPATFVPTQTDALVQQPILRQTDVGIVAGCPFTLPGGKYSPCVQVKWMPVGTSANHRGTELVHESTTGLCYNAEQVPQGAPIVVAAQAVARV